MGRFENLKRISFDGISIIYVSKNEKSVDFFFFCW